MPPEFRGSAVLQSLLDNTRIARACQPSGRLRRHYPARLGGQPVHARSEMWTMDVRLAYGEKGLTLHLPHRHIDVVEPRFLPGLPDEGAAVADGLRNPI